MRLLAPAVAAVALLTTACAAAPTGAGADGAQASPSASPVADPGVDGVRVVSVTLPRGGRTMSAAYVVVNKAAEPMRYTFLVDFTTDGGELVEHREVVVDVGPGRTGTGEAELGSVVGGSGTPVTAKVSRVLRVPVAEAPSASGPCPPSGLHVHADDGNAAMGLRTVGVRLVNCGKDDYTLDGFPQLALLDGQYEPVTGVDVQAGPGSPATDAGESAEPRPLTLAPGEGAVSVIVWRNTTELGTAAVNVPYVRVRAKSGAAPVTLALRLDLGTTGKLGVGPWRAAPADEGSDRPR